MAPGDASGGPRRAGTLWAGAIGLLLVAVGGGFVLVHGAPGGSDGQGGPGLSGRSGRSGEGGTPWTRYTVHGTVLRIEFEGAPCDRAGPVAVDESDERVVITLHVVHPRGSCISLAVGHQADAELAAPLGDRPVYDGSCLADSPTADDPDCRRHQGRS